jgi:hypothetical protein
MKKALIAAESQNVRSETTAPSLLKKASPVFNPFSRLGAVVRASAEDLVLGHVCLHVGSTSYRQSSDYTTGMAGLKDSNFLMQFSRSSPINGPTEITPKPNPTIS